MLGDDFSNEVVYNVIDKFNMHRGKESNSIVIK